MAGFEFWSDPPARRTALITGATGGLGAEFAVQLAAAGWTAVLVGRTEQALAETAERIASQGWPLPELLVADLTEPDQLAEVENRLAEAGWPVDLLVNNAGVLGRIAPLADQEPRSLDHQVDLDVRAVVRLCRAALPGMVSRAHGGILNVSSVMAFLPAPQGATYAASKAFVNSFSESIYSEVRNYGIRVTAVCPGSVRTGLHRSSGRKGGRFGPFLEPETVVHQALSALAAGRLMCVPGRRYQATAAMSRLAPRSLVRRYVESRFGGR